MLSSPRAASSRRRSAASTRAASRPARRLRQLRLAPLADRDVVLVEAVGGGSSSTNSLTPTTILRCVSMSRWMRNAFSWIPRLEAALDGRERAAHVVDAAHVVLGVALDLVGQVLDVPRPATGSIVSPTPVS